MNGAIEYWQRLDYLAKVNLLHVGVWLAYWLVFGCSWYYATLYTILSFFVIRPLAVYLRFRPNYKLPSPKGSNFLTGSIHLMADVQNLVNNMSKWANESRHIFYLRGPIGYPGAVIVSDAQVLRPLMSRDTPKSILYRLFYPWLGIGLLTANGQVWKRKRRMLTGAFHFQILKKYTEVYVTCTQICIERCTKHVNGESFDIFPYITALTLDIITQCAFGQDIKAQSSDEFSEYINAVKVASESVFARVRNPALLSDLVFNLTSRGRRWRRALKVIHDLPDMVIKARRAQRHQAAQAGLEAPKHLDFLDLLLATVDEATNQPLEDLEIRNEVDTFMFEGHDTTAAGLCWAIYNFGKYPEALQHAHAEIDHVLGAKSAPSYEDLSKFDYLERCIKETLRLFPPVPFYMRQVPEPTQLGPYLVAANTEVFISPYNVHRNPQYWSEPVEAFDPDRFSPAQSSARDPFAYIPFSAGNRNCIGQHFALNEEKTVLALWLRRFVPRVDPAHPVHMVPLVILKPEQGVKIWLTERS
jgi:cytochrome P450